MSSSPPTCQTPSLPSASRAASSSSVMRQSSGMLGRWRRSRLRFRLRVRLGRGHGVASFREMVRRRLAVRRAASIAGSATAPVPPAASASAARTAPAVATAARDDRQRVAARLEALERRLADEAVARPAAELGADHELGPDPVTSPGRRPSGPCSPWAAAGRTAASSIGQRLELSRAGSLRIAPVEPGADLAGEPQLAVLVDADGDGPELPRVALARRPAADDELLLGPDLDLQPGRASAAGLVPASAGAWR